MVSCAEYLQVIDKDFNFEDHITGLEKRVARSVGILFKLGHIFPQSITLQLHYALVHPLILYNIIIWESIVAKSLYWDRASSFYS